MFRPFWSMLTLAFAISVVAQKPDVPEPGSVEAIAAATTDPHFVSPWVSYVPASDKVPSPEKFLGRIMGAPGELLGSEKSLCVCARPGCREPASSRVHDWEK